MANQVLYGLHQRADLYTDAGGTLNIPVFNRAIDQGLAEYNSQLDAMLNLLVQRTTDPILRYKQFANVRSQPLDQNGRALPIKQFGHYDLGFPIQASGNAWGANYVTQAQMTPDDVNNVTAALMIGDTLWMTDHILATFFANTTWAFEDQERGTITVQPLANGDTVKYSVMNGASAAATDTHQFAQAAGIADATNPYPTIFQELSEHPENAGKVVAFIPTNLKATTQALATFFDVIDGNIRRGADNDEFVGTLGIPTPGTLIGYESSGVFVVEWPSLPDNYIIAATTQGAKPLGMREFPQAALQGFNRVAERQDHPFYESQYARWAGFGAWNRVGGLVYRIGNGTYAVPTGFTVPMP